MAKGNFPKVLAETLKHEGGWSDHPDDPGNATMRGVTIGVFAEFKGRKVTKAELRDFAAAICMPSIGFDVEKVLKEILVEETSKEIEKLVQKKK